MPTTNLTKTTIAKLPAPDPSGKQVLHWDRDLKGFAVLCSGVSPAKTYIVQRVVARKTRRMTIGPTNVLDLDGARAKAAALIAQMLDGVDPKERARSEAAAKLTLGDALQLYVEARKDLRPASLALYRIMANTHLSDWLDRPIREIGADDIERRHREIREKVAGRRTNDMVKGNHSANLAIRVLSIVWNFARDREPSLPENPVGRRMRRAWYPEERRTRCLTDSQYRTFYSAVSSLSNHGQRDAILLTMLTGMRKLEVLGLRWEEIDFAERLIRLPAGRTKAHRPLILPMSDWVQKILVARQGLGRSGEFVFAGPGEAGHVAHLTAAFGEIERLSRIRLAMHDLRRGFVTIAESLDLSSFAIKRLVNHSIKSDVTQGYIVSGAERLRDPMQRVTDRLKVLCGLEEPAGNVMKLSA